MTRTRAASLRLAGLLGGVAIGGLVASVALGDRLELVRSAASTAGVWGGAVFVALHVVVCVLPVPRSGLAAIAGALYGVSAGIALSLLGSVLAAIATFAMARRFGRKAVEQLRGPHIDRVEQVLRDRGLLTLIAARLMPVPPFAVTNYGAGLSSIRTRDYLGSLIGLLPGSIAWATVGASVGLDERVLYLGAAIAGVVIVGTVLLRQRARRSAHLGLGVRPCGRR